MTIGLVYYALDATRKDQYVKIGLTACLRERMIQLRKEATSRQTPLVLAVEVGDSLLEQQRHDEFSELRVRGEWFRYAGNLVAHVAGLDDPYEYLHRQPDLRGYAAGWCSLQPIRPVLPAAIGVDF